MDNVAEEDQISQIHMALEQLYADDNADPPERQAKPKKVDLKLKPGQFIIKATNRGWNANKYSTYFAYHGSLSSPGKQCFIF